MCKYTYKNGKKCQEANYGAYDYCILHVDIPKDPESDEFSKVEDLKKQKIQEKIQANDFNFEGLKIFELQLTDFNSNADINFSSCFIYFDLSLECITTKGSLLFSDSEVSGCLALSDVEVGGNLNLSRVSASSVVISDANVREDLIFIEAKLGAPLPYDKYEVCGDRRFRKLSTLENVLSIEDGEVKGAAVFNEVKVEGSMEVKNFRVSYDLRLPAVEVTRDVNLINTKIKKSLVLRKIKIDRDFNLLESTIDENIFFEAADVYGDITVSDTKIGKDLQFTESKVNRSVFFSDVNFGRAINIEHAFINGRVDFKSCYFYEPYGQEVLSRRAKISCEKFGDRAGADNYFYLEMAGRRKRKKWFVKYPELLIQYCFSYGTKWLPIIFLWFGMVLASGISYWIGHGLEISGHDKSGIVSFWGAQYFSVVTATTLGYGDYQPIFWWSKLLAGFEASFGMFLWACFIAVFARKYMR